MSTLLSVLPSSSPAVRQNTVVPAPFHSESGAQGEAKRQDNGSGEVDVTIEDSRGSTEVVPSAQHQSIVKVKSKLNYARDRAISIARFVRHHSSSITESADYEEWISTSVFIGQLGRMVLASLILPFFAMWLQGLFLYVEGRDASSGQVLGGRGSILRDLILGDHDGAVSASCEEWMLLTRCSTTGNGIDDEKDASDMKNEEAIDEIVVESDFTQLAGNGALETLYLFYSYRIVVICIVCCDLLLSINIMFDRIRMRDLIAYASIQVGNVTWYLLDTLHAEATPFSLLCIAYFIFTAWERNRRHNSFNSRKAGIYALMAMMISTFGGSLYAIGFGSIDRSLNPAFVLILGGLLSSALSWILIKLLSHPSLGESERIENIQFLLLMYLDMACLQAQRDYITELDSSRNVFYASLGQAMMEILRHLLFTCLKVRKWVKEGGSDGSTTANAIPRLQVSDLLTDISAEHITMWVAAFKAISLDPLLFNIGSPVKSHKILQVLSSLLIQFGFELVADITSTWFSLRIWCSVGVRLPLGHVCLERRILLFVALVTLACYFNIGFIIREECFRCGNEGASKTCVSCLEAS